MVSSTRRKERWSQKREVEPKEILHDHLSVTQTSEYYPTNPPQDQLATHEIQVEEEKRPHDEYKSMPHTESETKHAHLHPATVSPKAGTTVTVDDDEEGCVLLIFKMIMMLL